MNLRGDLPKGEEKNEFGCIYLIFASHQTRKALGGEGDLGVAVSKGRHT